MKTIKLDKKEKNYGLSNGEFEAICMLLKEFEKELNYSGGFTLLDIKQNSYTSNKLTYLGELVELIFGEYEWTKRQYFNWPKLLIKTIEPLVNKHFCDMKLEKVSFPGGKTAYIIQKMVNNYIF